jgi:hypothetical protein
MREFGVGDARAGLSEELLDGFRLKAPVCRLGPLSARLRRDLTRESRHSRNKRGQRDSSAALQ